MVILPRHIGPFTHRVVLFATAPEISRLESELRPNEVIDLQQTLCDPAKVAAHVVLGSGTTVCTDLMADPEDLFRRLVGSRRTDVRRGERLGERVDVVTGQEAAWNDFLTLHRDFVRWKRYTTRPLSRRRLARFRPASDVVVAYLDGEPEAAHVLVRDENLGRVRLVFSASARQHGGEAARWSGAVNSYLHWWELLHYRDAGFAKYDFGGAIADGSSSLAKFKLSFGGAVETGGNGRMVGALVAPVIAGLRIVHRPQ